jgi:electron transfer flavoprotein alpha subunit
MLGEARRLMDKYNRDYHADEKVVAVVLGHHTDTLCQEAIERGADVVYTSDHAELEFLRTEVYTKIIGQMSTGTDEYKAYSKPRYFLFPATINGRDLSATVLAVLESGCASDCNKLYIEDVKIKHPFKTGGAEVIFERVLNMKRPDFSGFEWSTILCLDNVSKDGKVTKEYWPQACSVIPGSFAALPRETSRKGRIVNHAFNLGAEDLRVRIVKRERLTTGIDLTKYDVLVSIGRGIAENPDEGIKLGQRLAKTVGGEMGVSRGVVTAKYKVDPSLKNLVEEVRQIGETGQMVKPRLYIAVGISGAIQHKKGMDKSGTIVAINTEENAPIREFSDVYVHGDLFKVLPRLISTLEAKKGGR